MYINPTIATTDHGNGIIELTKWDTDRCVQCEQMLDLSEPPTAVNVYDQFGNFNGEYEFQHGCGAHNPPASVIVKDGDVDAGIAELNAKVENHLAALRAEWAKRGERLLKQTQAELDAITDPEEREEFLCGRDGNHGELIAVNWDGDELFAEVYPPTLTENDEPEEIYA